MKAKSALSVALVAGLAGASVAANTPTELSPSSTTVKKVAHIYFNIASGEKVVTLLGDGQTAPVDNGVSGPIWSSRVANMCAAQGFSTSYFFGLDDNSGTTSLATDATSMQWGDLPTDTVVDCVHLDWVTDHDDVDTDSDGLGDGVVGLAGQWTYWDSENGRILNNSTRLPIISFIFTDLPGDTSGTTDPDDPLNTLAGYTADVDLAATFTGTSLVFELCDSDGDLQGTLFGNNDVDIDSDGIGDGISIGDTSTDGNGNPTVDRDFDGNPDWDLDLDGLADFGWSVRFFQPGTADLDSDGNLDGDIADSMKTIGISFAVPEGTAIDNGDTTWTWEIDTAPTDAGTGYEDAFALFDASFAHIGTFFFGGLSCVADENGQYGPSTGFEHQLFGPDGDPVMDGCDVADLAEPFGTHNFFDVSAFLGAFGAMEPAADLAEPFGVFNFFDVSAFLGEFGNGCP